MNRRDFLKKSAGAALWGAAISPSLVSAGFPSTNSIPDIAVADGIDYYLNTKKAVDELGGMSSFVKTGQKVGLLINSDFEIPGAYVHPDISLAALKMCFQQGASEVCCLQKVQDEYWQRSKHFSTHSRELGRLQQIEANRFPSEFNDVDFIKKEFPENKALKEAEIVKKVFEVDVLIGIAIAKHHALTFYTGLLKNMMGLGTRKSNVFFHLGATEKNDPDHLGQCIAEISAVRKPDLCIIDATEFIISNGPVGPGEILKKDKILAGTDPVAMDALAATYSDYHPRDINHIVKAFQSGLGEIDYSKLIVNEI